MNLLGQEMIFELASMAKEFITNQSIKPMKSTFEERVDRQRLHDIEIDDSDEDSFNKKSPSIDQDFQLKV